MKSKKEQILDSNVIGTSIRWCCHECGATANALTCMQRYGNVPKQLQFEMSTWHEGKCDYCGEKKMVTETRDFFHPDFGLIPKVIKFLTPPDKS